MHAVGTTGFGHRPYEDAAELKWGTLTFFNPFDQANAANNAAAVRQARTIVERAFQWRTIIQQWRAAHGNSTNVPIRDLVTALADQTRLKAGAQPTVYKPHASVEYLLGSKSDAIDEYQTPAIADFQRDLMMDGVAVMLALLVSAMEVSQ